MAQPLLLTILPPGMRGRFAAVADQEPLNALAPVDRAELDVILERVTDFDELPGRWQAALLRAEAGIPAPAPGEGSCCGGAQ